MIVTSEQYTPTVLEVYMRRRGYTQATLGRELRLDQAVVSNIINGIKPLSDENAKAIAKLLRISDARYLLLPFDINQQYEAQM